MKLDFQVRGALRLNIRGELSALSAWAYKGQKRDILRL